MIQVEVARKPARSGTELVLAKARMHDYGQNHHEGYYDANGDRHEFRNRRKIAKPIPEELWPEMKKAGYPFDSLNYVIMSNGATYDYLESKKRGYTEGITLSDVVFIHESGATFKLSTLFCFGKDRERILHIGNDDRMFVIYFIEPYETELLASPYCFNRVNPRGTVIPRSEEKPLKINGFDSKHNLSPSEQAYQISAPKTVPKIQIRKQTPVLKESLDDWKKERLIRLKNNPNFPEKEKAGWTRYIMEITEQTKEADFERYRLAIDYWNGELKRQRQEAEKRQTNPIFRFLDELVG